MLPPVFRSIGIYVFASPPPLMLPLGALLLLTIVTAGLARSSPLLAIQERSVLSLRCAVRVPIQSLPTRCNIADKKQPSALNYML